MTYQVLARKYRPQTFEDTISQEAVTTTLKNAVTQGRLHHAYLFAGPRGVGKTSLARIFSKCLNCETGPAATPCQNCTSCQEITAGNALDVQEIDGASNTSVDDIRRLRENVKYTPASGRYKIYIIDEVHMLSKSAFAALLKTLEEPPEHVRFIFATTDPEKIPATILSRVLRFDFRRPSTEVLVKHLANIAKQEKITIDKEGLLWIARQAEGSVRDALSLLDRVVSFAGQKIKTEDVLQSLGIRGRAAIQRLLQLCLERQSEAALLFINELYQEGLDFKQFGQEFLEVSRDTLVYKVVGAGGFPDWSQGEHDAVKALVEAHELADLEYIFYLFHKAYRDIVYSPLPKVLLEITVLRLCTRVERHDLSQLIAQLEGNAPTPRPAPSQSKSQPKTAGAPAAAKPTRPEPSAPATDRWQAFLQFVSKKKASLAPVLEQAQWLGETDTNIQLQYPQHSTYKAMLEDQERQKIITQLSQDFFKKEVRWEAGTQGQANSKETTAADHSKSIVDDAISIFNPKETELTG